MDELPGGVEFGLFDWIDRRDPDLGRTFEERLRLLEYADSTPFFCYHLAEHHATPLGLAPSPALFLSAAAQRTSRIRLGPLVYLLPLYNPLRLIEEVGMLDQLSGGRLELGVGRGVSPYELGYHHVDPAQSREIFRETLAVLCAGLTRERLTFSGKHLRFDDVPMILRTRQQPYPPLWYATSTIDSIPWAAEHGLHLMRLGPAAALAEGTALYRRAWNEHGADAGRLNAHVATPRLGVNRQIYVAASTERALEEARAAHAHWWESFDYLWRMHGDHAFAVRGGFDDGINAETLIVGSPERVREVIARTVAQSGCSYVTLAFAWGSMSYEQSLNSMKLFAEEVMPAFRRPALEPA